MDKSRKHDVEINIRYSLGLEVQRVFSIKQKAEWFEKMGYKLSLPDGVVLRDIKNFSAEQLKEFIKKEYKENDYKKAEIKIQEEWAKESTDLKEKLSQGGLIPFGAYNIFLTKYGVGGSYNLPNQIIINFQKKEVRNIPMVIIHEIIHLLIEHLIQKHNIEHWQKERIVDLFFSKIKPGLNRMQNLPIDTGKINETFNNFYPDIEKIIENLK